MIKGKLLRAMIETGLSINLMTENFGNNKEQEEKLKVFTINGSMELKKRITLYPCKICPTNQKFYLHTFSNNYDILIGRDYLKDSKTKIDYEKETVMLGDTLLYIKFGENDIVKGKTAVKCLSPPSVEKKIEEDKTASECLNPPLSKDQSFNFAINNELKECNEYRLEHLNEEEKENLKRVLFEYTDIQYKEGENLTFTSTIGIRYKQNMRT